MKLTHLEHLQHLLASALAGREHHSDLVSIQAISSRHEFGHDPRVRFYLQDTYCTESLFLGSVNERNAPLVIPVLVGQIRAWRKSAETGRRVDPPLRASVAAAGGAQ